MSICRILSNVCNNVPVRHHLRYHRKPSGERADIDSDELQKVRMGDIHPDDTLLAKTLYCMSLRECEKNGRMRRKPFGPQGNRPVGQFEGSSQLPSCPLTFPLECPQKHRWQSLVDPLEAIVDRLDNGKELVLNYTQVSALS